MSDFRAVLTCEQFRALSMLDGQLCHPAAFFHAKTSNFVKVSNWHKSSNLSPNGLNLLISGHPLLKGVYYVGELSFHFAVRCFVTVICNYTKEHKL